MTDRYSALGEDVETSKQEAQNAGLGFSLPAWNPAIAPDAPKIVTENVLENAA
jgi:hypothetical protein